MVGVGTPPNKTEEVRTEPIVVSPVGVKTCATDGAMRFAGVISEVAVEESEVPIVLVAETLNVYFRPFTKEFANVQIRGVGKGTFKVQVNAGLIATPYSSYASTS